MLIAARHAELRARFARSVQCIGAAGDVVQAFDDLAARYAESHRHYHSLAHIDACLGWLDWFHASAEHPAEVELALWFHDAVYDLGADDNERRSAELAVAQLGRFGCDGDSIRRIASHIEATMSHLAPRGDATMVIDIDLAILGAAPSDFQHFEDAIRREYAQVEDGTFAAGRKRVLEGFLARNEIYRTSGIRAELERAARVNLARRICELSRVKPLDPSLPLARKG